MKLHLVPAFLIMTVLLSITIYSKPNTAVHLEGLYATSINFPHSKNGPEQLFDRDKSTSWSTMPGAGPDEGVMLFFSKYQYLNQLQLVPAISDSSVTGIEYVLYINGIESPIRKISRKDFNSPASYTIKKNVKSLYIKVYNVYFKSQNAKQNGITYTYSKPVSFSELILTDRQNNKLNIVPPVVMKGAIQASSSLVPTEAYNPDFLFDSRQDFGWADGREKQDGKGESLTFTFNRKQSIEKIKIWNGYQRSPSHFTANERVKKMTFGEKGKNGVAYTIRDSSYPQTITLKSPLSAKSFTLYVNEIYPGKKYKDLCISEIRFFNGKDWLTIDSGGVEKRKRALLKQVRSTKINNIIDKRIVLDLNRHRNTQSIILRSNGSFVLWKKDISSSATKTVYADGNWQIKGGNKIRIFGRLHKISEHEDVADDYDPYAGSRSSKTNVNTISIFSDTIILGANQLKSSKNLFKTFSY